MASSSAALSLAFSRVAFRSAISVSSYWACLSLALISSSILSILSSTLLSVSYFSAADLARVSAIYLVLYCSALQSRMWALNLPFSASSWATCLSISLLKPSYWVHSPLRFASSYSRSPRASFKWMYSPLRSAYSYWSPSRWWCPSSTSAARLCMRYSFNYSFCFWSLDRSPWSCSRFWNRCLRHLIWSSSDW